MWFKFNCIVEPKTKLILINVVKFGFIGQKQIAVQEKLVKFGMYYPRIIKFVPRIEPNQNLMLE